MATYYGNNRQQQSGFSIYGTGPQGDRCGTGYVWKFFTSKVNDRIVGYCFGLPGTPACWEINVSNLTILDKWDPTQAKNPDVAFKLKMEEDMGDSLS